MESYPIILSTADSKKSKQEFALENTMLWIKKATLSSGQGKFVVQIRVKNVYDLEYDGDEKKDNSSKDKKDSSDNYGQLFNLAVLDSNGSSNKLNVQLDHKIDSQDIELSVKKIGNDKSSEPVEITLMCNRQEFNGVSDSENDSEEEDEEDSEDVSKFNGMSLKDAAKLTGCDIDDESESEDEEVPKLVPVTSAKKETESNNKAEKRPSSDSKDNVLDPKSDDTKRRKLQIEEARKKQIEEKKVEKAKKEEEEKAAKATAAAEKKKAEEELLAKKKKQQQQAEAEKAKQQKLQKEKAEQEAAKKKKPDTLEKYPIKRSFPSGLKVEIHKKGHNTTQIAKPGRTVKVRYDGCLASNGKRFDKGVIDFKLGTGMVIRGWDEGVKDMCIGEKRRLLIPANLGYGSRGAPPQIPRNAALIFEVELLGIK